MKRQCLLARRTMNPPRSRPASRVLCTSAIWTNRLLGGGHSTSQCSPDNNSSPRRMSTDGVRQHCLSTSSSPLFSCLGKGDHGRPNPLRRIWSHDRNETKTRIRSRNISRYCAVTMHHPSTVKQIYLPMYSIPTHLYLPDVAAFPHCSRAPVIPCCLRRHPPLHP